jgi:hypothetical protein
MAQLRILRLQDERQGAGLLRAGTRHRSPKLESAGRLSGPQYVNLPGYLGAFETYRSFPRHWKCYFASPYMGPAAEFLLRDYGLRLRRLT